MTKHFVYLLLLIFFSNVSFSQNNTGEEIRLANEYFRSKDYDKAEVLFKKIFDYTNAKIYFTYYITCIIEQAKYDPAEKEIKKQIRKYRNDPSYLIELGYLYKVQGQLDKSTEQYEKVLKKLYNNPQVIRSVASSFIQRSEYDYAQKTYLKGRLITSEVFRSELANLYAIQRKFDAMINEYLDWLQVSSRNIIVVQNRMQYYINKDINDEFSTILRKELLKRIQKPQSSIVFNRMLVWHYMQRKEFTKALFQAKAIDKRLNSSGKDILTLAETSKSNEDYETALDAYNYIIKKGKNKPYYIHANVGRLNVYYLKVTTGNTDSEEEIQKLEEDYIETLDLLGINFQTIQSVIDLAHLKTFYLDKPKEAESLLNEAINLRGLHKIMATTCKITLGDVLVYQNDLDYATLIYGQAEKDNKGNLQGDEAKLKKAKLAYYANNFRWAKAQFDALKASTSKPVANDALFYSILISDNTDGDSLQTAMKLYAGAELLVFRHKKNEALNVLDSILQNYSGHQIIDEVYLLKAKIYEQYKEFDEAVKFYQKVFTEFSGDILADLAIFRLAVLYEEELQDVEEAAEYFKKLMLEHPDSIYVTEARKRFRAIRDRES